MFETGVLVNVIELLHEDVTNLQSYSLGCLGLLLTSAQYLVNSLLIPFEGCLIVSSRLDVFQQLAELQPQKHQELVDPEVVNLIPVQVENVQEGLEPLLLLGTFLKVFHYRRDLFAAFLLILWLVRVPNHEE